MRRIKRLSATIVLVALSTVIGIISVKGDSTAPVNYAGVSLNPITTTISYNYDFLAGELSPGRATATALTINGLFLTSTADPDPPGNGFGTFFGSAYPVHFQGDQVVNTTSVCPGFLPVTGGTTTCLPAGTITFGGFIIVHNFGSSLIQVTDLASQYYVQQGTLWWRLTQIHPNHISWLRS